MMTITEKVSYLKGLCEGVGISDETKEGRIIKAMIDVLDDMALTISDMEDGFAEVCEQVDAIDEDLGSLDEDYYVRTTMISMRKSSTKSPAPAVVKPSASMKKCWMQARWSAPVAVSISNLILMM